METSLERETEESRTNSVILKYSDLYLKKRNERKKEKETGMKRILMIYSKFEV